MNRLIKKYILIGIGIIAILIFLLLFLSINFSNGNNSDSRIKKVKVNLGENINILGLDEEVLEFEKKENVEIEFLFTDEKSLTSKIFSDEDIYLESIFEEENPATDYNIAKIDFITLGINKEALGEVFINPGNIEEDIKKLSNKEFFELVKKINSWILMPKEQTIKVDKKNYKTKSENKNLTGTFAFSSSNYENLNRLLTFTATPYMKNTSLTSNGINIKARRKIAKEFLDSINNITNNMASLFAPGIRGNSFQEDDYYSNENIMQIFMDNKAIFNFINEKTYSDLLLKYPDKELEKIDIFPLKTSIRNYNKIAISNIYSLKINDNELNDKKVEKVYQFLLKNADRIKSPFEKKIETYYNTNKAEYIYGINLIKDKKLKEILREPFLNKRWDFEDLDTYINNLAKNIKLNE